MRLPPVRLAPLAAATLVSVVAAGRSANAQSARPAWVGVGAIGQTVMYMDTTSIERDGFVRRVWMESLDPQPNALVVGIDTTRFDTVISLHVFDCRAQTHAVAAARYYLAGVEVAPPRGADMKPEPLRRGSFMAAVASDLCGTAPSRR